MQDIISLYRNFPKYNNFQDLDLQHHIKPSLFLNQYKKHYDNKQLIGFTNWAYLSDYAYNHFKKTAIINYKEWNSGDNLVFVEFIAIKNVRKIFRWCINMSNKFKGLKDNFMWLRVNNNKIERIIVKDI
nr:RTX toxin acyltransferase family protein [uncultured Mediterranean phage uvMED]